MSSRSGSGLLEETPGAPDQLAVGVDLALGAEIADEIPVQRGVIHAAELLERRAERDVHRSADLLVEEDVLREAVDLVVHPDGDLSEPARPRVEAEHRVEDLAAARRLCRDDAAVLDARPDVV